MRDISSGSIRMTPKKNDTDDRYPLTFVMAKKVINTNVDREVALQAMQRLHSCYHNALEILKTNKVYLSSSKLTPGINSSGIIFSREYRIFKQH
jgi:hypothetical protein